MSAPIGVARVRSEEPCSLYAAPPATIADTRCIGLSAVIIERAALYCHHQPRIEFDASRLPDELHRRYQAPSLCLHEVRVAGATTVNVMPNKSSLRDTAHA